MDVPQVLATWIHTLAFVIAWGYYGVLGRIVIPALDRSMDPDGLARTLAAVERRALPLVLLSTVLFGLSGTWLLLADPRYAGLGNVLASDWTLLMAAKHGLVIALVVLAVVVDVRIRRLPADRDPVARRSDVSWIRFGAEGATALGALIALLTAAAAVSG